MRLRLLFAGAALALAAVAPADAGDRYTINFEGKTGVLGVVDGQPCLVSPRIGDHYWNVTLAVGRPPISIRVIGPEKWRGRYLAYDPKARGKDKGAVLLADELGEGTRWVLENVKGEPSTVFTVRADSGTVKGWYLAVEEQGKEFKDKSGKKAKAHRLFLSEKPKEVPRWVFTVISP